MARVLKEEDKAAKVFTDDRGLMNVVYNKIPIVKFNDKTIILSTKGQYTPQIKNKMNQASKEFKLGYEITQRDGKWFCEYGGREYEWGLHGAVILGRSGQRIVQ